MPQESRVHFDLGSAASPPDASETLVTVADSARMQAGRVGLPSGFHDAIELRLR